MMPLSFNNILHYYYLFCIFLSTTLAVVVEDFGGQKQIICPIFRSECLHILQCFSHSVANVSEGFSEINGDGSRNLLSYMNESVKFPELIHWEFPSHGIKDKSMEQGMMLLRNWSVDDAATIFRDVIKRMPNVSFGYYGCGLCHLLGRSLDDAVRELEFSMRNKVFFPAKEILLEILALIPSRQNFVYGQLTSLPTEEETARLLMLRGYLELRKFRKFEEAEKSLRKSLRSRDGFSNYFSYSLLAKSLLLQNKLAESIQVNMEADKLVPSIVTPCHDIGVAKRLLGDDKRAESVLVTCLERFPRDRKLLYQMAILLYNRGDTRGAQSYCEQSVSLDDGNSKCHFLLGLCAVCRGNTFSAVKSFSRVVHSETPEASAAFYLLDYVRYFHLRAPLSLELLLPEMTFAPSFLSGWLHGEPYTDLSTHIGQPGLSPDIEFYGAADGNVDTDAIHSLICASRERGQVVEQLTDGSISNIRMQTAIGLATFHVAQILKESWNRKKSDDSSVPPKYSWRRLILILSRYATLVNPQRPFFLPSLVTPSSDFADFLPQTIFMRKGVKNLRMSFYLDDVLKMVAEQMLSGGSDGYFTSQELVRNITNFLGKAGTSFSLKSSVHSLEHQKIVLGSLLWTAHNEPEGTLSLSVRQLDMSSASMRKVEADVDFMFMKLEERLSASPATDSKNGVLDAALRLSYVLCNLYPIARRSGLIVHSLVVAIMHASGWISTSSLPTGRLFCMEARIAADVHSFVALMQSFMLLRPDTFLVRLPQVADVFPSISSVVSILSTAEQTRCT